MYKVLIVKDESSSEFPARFDYSAVKSEVKYRQYVEENGKLPDFRPKIIQHVYDDPEHNRLHDFILSPVSKMVVSEKVKLILLDFKLPINEFIRIKLRSVSKRILFSTIRKSHNNYFKFFYDCNYIDKTIDFIDFDRSKIEVKDGNGAIVDRTIRSSKDIYELIDSNKKISNEINMLYKDKNISSKNRDERIKRLSENSYEWSTGEIFLKPDIKEKYDLFELPLFSSMTYVSENIVQRFDKEKVTGISIVDAGVNSRLSGIRNPKVTI